MQEAYKDKFFERSWRAGARKPRKKLTQSSRSSQSYQLVNACGGSFQKSLSQESASALLVRGHTVRKKKTRLADTLRRRRQLFWIADISPQNEKYVLAGTRPRTRLNKGFL